MGGSRVVDKDLGWASTMAAVRQLAQGAYSKVGILSDDERGGLHKVDPETGKASPLTIAEIAAVLEFGTEDKHIPARSFVRATFDRMRGELEQDAAKLIAKIVIDRTMTVDRALNILGLKLATGIWDFISQGEQVPPPNAPSTIRAKVPASLTGKKRQRAIEGNRTLVDSGTMRSAISWANVLGTVEQAHKFLTGRK